MAVAIERAKPEDAVEILELMKVLGSETDNLSFGQNGIPMTVEKEMEFLSSIHDSEKELFVTARLDGVLVGTAHYGTFPKARMAHRGEIGISIRKSAWGMGIGSLLMQTLLDFAKKEAKADIVSLEVRSDNIRAIALYKKFGFEKVGCFHGYFKIRGELIDFDIMEKMLTTDMV